jgi:hypothetical protein
MDNHEFFTGDQNTDLTQDYVQGVLASWDWMDVQKMVFIYRAVQNGWCVRRLRNGKFEFKMDLKTREIYLEEYLRKFILYNLCLTHFPAPHISSHLLSQT